MLHQHCTQQATRFLERPLELPLQLPERLKLLEKSTPEDQFLQPQELHLSPALAQARLLFQKLLPSPAPAPPLSLAVESLEDLNHPKASLFPEAILCLTANRLILSYAQAFPTL